MAEHTRRGRGKRLLDGLAVAVKVSEVAGLRFSDEQALERIH